MDNLVYKKIELFQEQIKENLLAIQQYKPVMKDIIIVVHDQLDYLKNCVDSIVANTKNYRLYIWDNASDGATQHYLKTINAHVERSEENLGFIIPNNKLAKMGSSSYIILLNSDTVVFDGWDKAMIGWQQTHSNVAEVGYLGGKLDDKLHVSQFGFGSSYDYICGWCVCFRRDIYNEFGLFDDQNLDFAYCEDTDFSLRLREAGKEIYALHLDLVRHFENKTIIAVSQERDVKTSFEANLKYLKSRWSKFLQL